MFCPNCGTPNDNASFSCSKCGGPLKDGQAQPPPPPRPPAARPAYGPPQPAYGPPPAYGPQSNYGPPVGGMPQIPNHLAKAIISTLCCCWPLGIVAIIYAAQVNGKLAAGDVAGAQAASESANLWSWIAIGLGLLTNGGAFIFYMLMFAATAASA